MAILFGVLVGLALGLTGGGGSILAVPLLIYGLDIAPKNAISMSLAVVAAISLFGAFFAWYHRLLELRAALIFVIGGIVAAPLGVKLGDAVSEVWLMTGFAILMFAVAGRMLTDALRYPEQSSVVRGGFARGSFNEAGTVCRYSFDGKLRVTVPCGVVLILMGLLAGLLAGLFGVGGGFIIVPVLMLVTEMGIHRAVATSLLVIALIGLSGALSALFVERSVDWTLGLSFLAGGLIGMGLGRTLAAYVAGPRLQQIFAGAMLIIGSYMLLRQWV